MRNDTILLLAATLATSSAALSQSVTPKAPAGQTDLATPTVAPRPPFRQEISFGPAVNHGIVAPRDAALGDLERDGDLDIAVTSLSPERVVLLGNRGDGTFTPMTPVLLPAGSQPHTPVALDLEPDSDVDLAVTLSGMDGVQILVNNGLGVFSSPMVVPVGDEPGSLSFGDLDNDSDLDLAVVNRGDGSVSIVRNDGLDQGILTFSVTTQMVAQEPRELVLGDFDKDHLLDVAVASFDAQQVSVLRNIGAGTFGSPVNLKGSATVRPEGLDAADIDRDGFLDLVASSSSGGEDMALVFMNQGGGVFGQPNELPVHGALLADLDGADLNLDTDVDIACAVASGLKVLVNLGTGTFGSQLSLDMNAAATKVIARDLNGDSLPDLVTVNEGSNSVSVLLNDSPGIGCDTQAYCTGELNSGGTTAQIGSLGSPSATTQNFILTMEGAMPNKFGLAFYGSTGRQNVPFMGGILCVAGPLKRLPIKRTDPSGEMRYRLGSEITPEMADTQRWFQFWYRDPTAQDGNGVATSDALEVTFCN